MFTIPNRVISTPRRHPVSHISYKVSDILSTRFYYVATSSEKHPDTSLACRTSNAIKEINKIKITLKNILLNVGFIKQPQKKLTQTDQSRYERSKASCWYWWTRRSVTTPLMYMWVQDVPSVLIITESLHKKTSVRPGSGL